jgi:hypothetical protein
VTLPSIAERYSKAIFGGNYEALGDLRHAEFVARWPQSGEVVRGHDRWVQITKRYPQSGGDAGAVSGGEKLKVTRVKTPMPFGPPILAMSGGSDTFTVQGQIKYPNGSLYHVVAICELEGGKVIRETAYFCEPFEPPEWRADLVELES